MLGLTEHILAGCKVHLTADYAHPAQRIIIMGFAMWFVLLLSSAHRGLATALATGPTKRSVNMFHAIMLIV